MKPGRLRGKRRKPIPRLPLLKGRENLTPGQREVLEDIARKYPALFELYLLKEDLRSIARMEKRKEAEKALSRWCINAEHAQNLEGRVWAKTIRSWREEILNLVAYTEKGCRVTNGYLEGKNNLMKMLKRVSFGFRNRVHFIKKMLLGCCSQELIPQLLT
ncbi:MAG: transposase [Candidatus Hadarchaeales archaeon]